MENKGNEGQSTEKIRPTILEKEVEVCCICSEVPLNVVCCPECENGPFCKSCFEECLEKHNRCPTCNQQVPKLPSVNKVLQKWILKYAAQCSYEGCQKEASLEEILTHMANCGKKLVSCKNQSEGCTVSLMKEVIDEHEAQCQYARLQCACGASLLRKEEEEHQQTTCPTFPVSCDNCFWRIPRNQLAEHQSNHCPKRTVKCINSDVGCSYSNSYENYKQLHENSCPYALTAQGTRSLLELTKSMSLRIEKLEQKVEEQATTITTLKKLACGSFQRKGTAKVAMTVDFSKYQPKEKVISDEFKVAALSCNLELHPKGLNFSLKNSEVYLRVNSIMGSKNFLIVIKRSLGYVSSTHVSVFASDPRGCEMENEAMVTRNGIETLEFMVSVEVLDILMLGENAHEVNKVYKNMYELEKKKIIGSAHGVCTGTMSDATQEMFECKTCNAFNVCQVCAEKCHQTHKVVALGKKNWRCRCSADSVCKVLPFRTLFEQCNN